MTSQRSVLVTGASTGIGAACVSRLDQLGYRVFAGVRKPEDGDRLRSAGSDRIVPIRLDVTRSDEIAAAARTLDEAVGPAGLGGLVNNAGIAIGGPIEYLGVEAVRLQFEVNVFGLLAVTQALLPAIRRARGRIINIGSIAGRSVSPFVVPYCMSKYAVEALTDGLRLELAGTGIEVAVVEPGAVKTPIWDKGLDSLGDATRTLPPIAHERYGAKLKFFGKLLRYNDERGVPPEQVVDAVLHALEADRPRTRYLVGRDARIRAFLGRILPDRAGDALLLSVLARLERRLA